MLVASVENFVVIHYSGCRIFRWKTRRFTSCTSTFDLRTEKVGSKRRNIPHFFNWFKRFRVTRSGSRNRKCECSYCGYMLSGGLLPFIRCRCRFAIVIGYREWLTPL